MSGEEFAVFQFALGWVSKLAKAYKTVRRKHKKELSRIGGVFGPTDDIARYYIEPFCQQTNPADSDEDQTSSIVRSPVFTTIEHFLGGDVTERDGRSQFFVLADAGMGKTSLLVMLKLAHLNSFWPKGDDCVLLKLGPQSLSDIKRLLDPANTVLLLDSLDEDPEAWANINDRLARLLDATKAFRRTIITCRTQFFPRDAPEMEKPGVVTISGYRCPSVYLSFFTNEQVSAYLRKRFPRSFFKWLLRKDNKQHERALELMRLMKSLRLRPLLLSYVDQLIGEEALQLAATSAAMFDVLIDHWLRREERNARRRGEDVSAASLRDACTELAIMMEDSLLREVPEVELRKVTNTRAPMQTLEQFDFGGRALLNRNALGNYRFSHYTIQEFLLASFAVKGSFARSKSGKMISIRGTAQLGAFIRELLERPGSSPVQSLVNIKFLQAQFDRVKFPNSTFHNCDFTEASLCGAHLRQCRINSSRLFRAKFCEADLGLASLSACDARIADFQSADLRNAVLRGSRFDSANFANANLCGADLRESTIQGAYFVGAIFNDETIEPAGHSLAAAGARHIARGSEIRWSRKKS